MGAAILKRMSARVYNMPTQAADMLECLAWIPTIGDRWGRSVARSGALLALGVTVARYPKDDFQKITSGFPKVDKDSQAINPQEVMEWVGPYACRIARLVETDEFVEDEVAPEDAGQEFLAFENLHVDSLMAMENLPPLPSGECVLEAPAPEFESSETASVRRYVRVERSSPASA